MNRIFFLLFSFCGFFANAQVEGDLVAHYSFDNCEIEEVSGNGIKPIVKGSPVCACGAIGDGLRFNGVDQGLALIGNENYFGLEDFSISFFFKADLNTGQPMELLSRQKKCTNDKSLSLKIHPFAKQFEILMAENVSKIAFAREDLPEGSCWYHVAIVRDDKKVFLYFNGEQLPNPLITTSRIDLGSSTSLSFSKGPCIGSITAPFKGVVDEIMIFSTALDKPSVRALYSKMDKIITTKNTLIVGNSLPLEISKTCANSISWTPIESISDPSSPNPVITPEESTTYTAQFNYGDCIATDSFSVSVINLDNLDCSKVVLPSGFSPNGIGPIENETFGISNKEVIDELISFEIFDRWGGVMFQTADLSERWDGTFNNKEVEPGVYIYKLRYLCKSEESKITGSVALMR